jgi:hypothetical protein
MPASPRKQRWRRQKTTASYNDPWPVPCCRALLPALHVPFCKASSKAKAVSPCCRLVRRCSSLLWRRVARPYPPTSVFSRINLEECPPPKQSAVLMKRTDARGDVLGGIAEVLVYCLLNARIRPLASHYANEMQRTHDLRCVVFVSALSRSRERNRDEKIRSRISYFSNFAITPF